MGVRYAKFLLIQYFILPGCPNSKLHCHCNLKPGTLINDDFRCRWLHRHHHLGDCHHHHHHCHHHHLGARPLIGEREDELIFTGVCWQVTNLAQWWSSFFKEMSFRELDKIIIILGCFCSPRHSDTWSPLPLNEISISTWTFPNSLSMAIDN